MIATKGTEFTNSGMLSHCSERLYSLIFIIRTDVWVAKGHFEKVGLCGHFLFVPCHFEGREESEVGDCRLYSDFRFFTPLRCVQSDRVSMRCGHIERIDILLRGEGRTVWRQSGLVAQALNELGAA